MARRGATTLQKRQKEQQRKERQQEKFARRMERKKEPVAGQTGDSVEAASVAPNAGV
jgi:hypothetical protein